MGCVLPVKGHGFCCKHYQRFKKGQNPHTTEDRHRNICTVLGCNEFVKSQGLCQKHLQRKTKYGKNPYQPLVRDLGDISKFKLKYEETDGCWEWQGAKDIKGYGKFTLRENRIRTEKAHRIAYKLEYGNIPQNMLVCHKCDNPSCVNPEHLFLGTDSDNMIDMVIKNRHKPGKGRKLTVAEVKEIRTISHLHTSRFLAEMFSTSKANITAIVNRKTWKHI